MSRKEKENEKDILQAKDTKQTNRKFSKILKAICHPYKKFYNVLNSSEFAFKIQRKSAHYFLLQSKEEDLQKPKQLYTEGHKILIMW